MAVVAIIASDNDTWENGVWTCTPVRTAGQWRWVVELYRGGKLRRRRTVVHLTAIVSAVGSRAARSWP